MVFLSAKGFDTKTITELSNTSPLKAVGVEVGDQLLSYDGKKIFDPSLDINTFLYGEDGTEKEITFFDVSENKKVTKVITPGKTPARVRLGFTAKLVNKEATNIIDMIEVDSPLEKAGIKRGDRVIQLDDTPVTSTADIQKYLNQTRVDKLAPLTVVVERNGKTLTFNNVVPFIDFNYDLGFKFEYREKGSILEVARASVDYCISTMRSVIISIGWLFNGTVSVKEMSGPVGIIGAVGSVVESQESANVIFLNLIYFCSFISINLGVMNLIPFPALDGSMLLFLLIEKIRGKPLPQEKLGMISMIGFILLICVLIFTLFNDIPRWLM